MHRKIFRNSWTGFIGTLRPFDAVANSFCEQVVVKPSFWVLQTLVMIVSHEAKGFLGIIALNIS